MDKISIVDSEISNYCGIYLSSTDIFEEFWKIRCPCGITITYPVNELPLIDTMHPCGDPNHWTIKIGIKEEIAYLKKELDELRSKLEAAQRYIQAFSRPTSYSIPAAMPGMQDYLNAMEDE